MVSQLNHFSDSRIVKSLQSKGPYWWILPVIAITITTASLFFVNIFLSGLFSVLMRDMSNITHDGPKWIVLDGDIDPMWIESLNTVMDDNKVWNLFS